MRVPFVRLKAEFKRVLLKLHFAEQKAEVCAGIFASNSRDGVYSHGLNRFPAFVKLVTEGFVKFDAEAERIETKGNLEVWDGHLGPGMYNSLKCVDRAVEMAGINGISCVTIRNNNHWMRGGTYGWRAAEAGCIGICFTNASAGMPAWGGTKPVLGNNPLVIAVPRQQGHIVLDTALSQFSYGKLQEYQLRHEVLPVPGGYDQEGQLTTDPAKIMETKRALPIGYWKGAGLSLLLDIVLTSIGGGRSTAEMTQIGREAGLSQTFICIRPEHFHDELVERIVDYTKTSGPSVAYPGENTLRRRAENDKNGIPVNEEIWNSILKM